MTARLDWYGCATFRLTLPGEVVVFLDAYIDRVAGAAGPQPPQSADDVDRADWVVVGHSHFDHLWGAERIAERTGATIIGSYETVRVMSAAGVPSEQLMSVAGGERIRLTDDVSVAVYPSLHSCVWTHLGMHDADEVCLGDLGVVHQERLARFGDVQQYVAGLGPDTLAHLVASNQHARGDGGALLYLFDTPEGSLLYQDTSGHWSSLLHDLRPDVAILAAAGRGNVDGEPIQGSLAMFVAQQAALLRPKRVVLSHHDDWLPGFSAKTDTASIRTELERRVPRCELAEPGYLDGYELFAGLA
jgi:L-ascorbate metabolism protein UlaG (beta-lactamase superfamily)